MSFWWLLINLSTESVFLLVSTCYKGWRKGINDNYSLICHFPLLKLSKTRFNGIFSRAVCIGKYGLLREPSRKLLFCADQFSHLIILWYALTKDLHGRYQLNPVITNTICIRSDHNHEVSRRRDPWDATVEHRVRTVFQKQFSMTFPGLRFIQGSQMHNNWSNTPLQNRNPKIILQKLIVFKETLLQEFIDFQDFPLLENATIKFQDFPGPVQTLWISFWWANKDL